MRAHGFTMYPAFSIMFEISVKCGATNDSGADIFGAGVRIKFVLFGWFCGMFVLRVPMGDIGRVGVGRGIGVGVLCGADAAGGVVCSSGL